MSSRFTRRTATAAAPAAIALCALLVACSSSKSSGTSSSALVQQTDAGFPGCEPLAHACFTVSGDYPLPATSASCSSPGGPATGAADTHCDGVTPQAVDPASCAIDTAPSEDAGSDDAGSASIEAGTTTPTPVPAAGACGENSGDYGTTMYGSSGHDDDCKYAVSYTTSPICENDGTYFVVTANYLTGESAPLTGACTYAELCLNDTHPAPTSDANQQVVEGPPGTYTIGPILFDAAGQWTVRFHFNELCCDVVDSSPHGHAAFFVDVP